MSFSIKILRLLLIITILYNLYIHLNIISNNSIKRQKFTILNKYCRVKGGNYINLLVNGENKRLEVPYQLCEKLNVGSKMEVLFHEKSVYLVGSREYFRISIFSSILLLLSFVNFKKLIESFIDKISDNTD